MPDESAPLMLSVSGARGIVGASMSEDVAARYAAAFGEELGKVGGERLRLVIGRDGRTSGRELSEAVVATLSGMGCELIDIGVAPTPTAGIMIRELEADGGIVITASHNPIQWNGLKCLDSSGLAPPPEIVGRVIERFGSGGWSPSVAREPGTMRRDGTAVGNHVEKVLGLVDPELVRGAGLEVVLDSVNASGCE
ncbi:MAG: phosphoglucosamine mutase, partial [Planctomycetota bacterium]|nr:phosphoglucosamine mutase [Planctomycetota bacterium]